MLDSGPVLDRLDQAALEFLHESNLIENISNIDYSKPENAIEFVGHVGAFLMAMEAAKERTPLNLDWLCAWQRMITEEQVKHGVEIRPEGIGFIRSPKLPINVSVGSYVAPNFLVVPDLMRDYIGQLKTEPLTSADDPESVAAAVGDLLQEFEDIHPFIDGNGRVGRLIANYVAVLHGHPLMIFRAKDREEFYAAHQSRFAMRFFIHTKILGQTPK